MLFSFLFTQILASNGSKIDGGEADQPQKLLSAWPKLLLEVVGAQTSTEKCNMLKVKFCPAAKFFLRFHTLNIWKLKVFLRAVGLPLTRFSVYQLTTDSTMCGNNTSATEPLFPKDNKATYEDCCEQEKALCENHAKGSVKHKNQPVLLRFTDSNVFQNRFNVHVFTFSSFSPACSTANPLSGPKLLLSLPWRPSVLCTISLISSTAHRDDFNQVPASHNAMFCHNAMSCLFPNPKTQSREQITFFIFHVCCLFCCSPLP